MDVLFHFDWNACYPAQNKMYNKDLNFHYMKYAFHLDILLDTHLNIHLHLVDKYWLGSMKIRDHFDYMINLWFLKCINAQVFCNWNKIQLEFRNKNILKLMRWLSHFEVMLYGEEASSTNLPECSCKYLQTSFSNCMF